jgi:hypothetical protein
LNELVRPRHRPSIARACHFPTTIQDKLYAQVDILGYALTSNFNSIGKGGEGSMGPTRSAVLGEVLIELFGETACAVDVIPVPFFREIVYR